VSDNKGLWAEAAGLIGEAEVSRRFKVWIRGIIKKELERRNEKAPDELFLDEATLIVSDLNKLTGRNYRAAGETLKLIRGRMAEGYGVEDFKGVHKAMCSRWMEDVKMRDYLRPSTLYRGSKFAEYLALVPVLKVHTDLTDLTDKKEKAEKAEKAERDLVERLMGRKWWEFDSWGEFVRWTIQLPDAEAVARYEMPERIRKMRCAPGVVMKVLRGKVDWEEREYGRIKKVHTDLTDLTDEKEKAEKAEKAEETQNG